MYIAYNGRHHGCSRWIRTTSSAYEAEMLPLHHHCYIISNLSFLTFYKYYTIFFTKSQNFTAYVRKERKLWLSRFTNLCNGRSGVSRTPGLLIPNQAPYRLATPRRSRPSLFLCSYSQRKSLVINLKHAAVLHKRPRYERILSLLQSFNELRLLTSA